MLVVCIDTTQVTFTNPSGSAQSWSADAYCTEATAVLSGGAGGYARFFSLSSGSAGGNGALVTATFPVTQGGVVSAFVGGGGSGANWNPYSGSNGGGGGGASAVMYGGALLAVAGGGGGGGCGGAAVTRCTASAGAGGQPSGTTACSGGAGGTTTSAGVNSGYFVNTQGYGPALSNQFTSGGIGEYSSAGGGTFGTRANGWAKGGPAGATSNANRGTSCGGGGGGRGIIRRRRWGQLVYHPYRKLFLR